MSQALANLSQYVAKVTQEVRDRVKANKVPKTQEQLDNYIKQVVVQLQNLTKGAPKKVLDQLNSPFDELWDMRKNEPIVQMSSKSFLGLLEELEETFPIAQSKPAAPSAWSSGKGDNSSKGGKGADAKNSSPSTGDKAGKGGKAAETKEVAPPAAVKPASKPEPTKPAMTASAPLFVPGQGGGGMSANAPVFMPGKSWSQDVTGKEAGAKTRRDVAPPISEASTKLPTYEKKDWVIAGIRHNTVTVISGDTGCGKSTLIPQLVCDAENLVPDDKVVVCTQPRRVAAITLAEYVAKDRGQELGDEVGYQIRFINKFGDNTRLIYATTAIVLRRLHSEPTLDSIGCLIIDEVHERDVYTDFLLLLLKEAMLKGKMPHLKIVLMSATLKAADFADYFKKVNGNTALKPVHIPGRMFPVKDYYFEDACEWLGWCPPEKGAGKGGKKGGKGKGYNDAGDEGLRIQDAYDKIMLDNTPKDRPGKERCNEYSEQTLKACAMWRENEVYIELVEDLVHYIHKEMPMGEGAILIFLPGWGDIVKLFLRLYSSGENFTLITLHSLMTPEQQHEAFVPAPDGFRKVVLSTNIAEASVTINDIVYVIDTGVRKERSFDPNTAISSLDTKMVTRANAIQRRGRAGRCQEGMVIHLFPSYKFPTFEEFPMPQMLTSSMEEVVLQSKVIHGGTMKDISSMLTDSMAAPKPEAISQAIDCLKSMSCLTHSGELTVLGKAVAAIPVDPKVAKFLLIAGAFRCIKPAACIAAFLSIKSPFQQTVGSEQNEKSSSKQVTGKDYFNKGYASDHLTNVQAYVEWRRECGKGKGDEFCDLQGLSPETLDMGYMMIQQFVQFMVDAGYDGPDIGDGSDLAEVASVKKASDEDALVRGAMVAGFSPCLACLYRGQRSPWWYVGNDEVSPFRGSANAEYQMHGQDGDEWMIFSDSMKMGRFNSIMDSSLVFSPFVLLFANALLIDDKKGEIRFDKWWAKIESGPWVKELLDLRSKIMPAFASAIENRDLSVFPQELTARIAKFCKQNPMKLKSVEATAKSIEFDISTTQRKLLSMYEWKEDTGGDEDEDGA